MVFVLFGFYQLYYYQKEHPAFWLAAFVLIVWVSCIVLNPRGTVDLTETLFVVEKTVILTEFNREFTEDYWRLINCEMSNGPVPTP